VRSDRNTSLHDTTQGIARNERRAGKGRLGKLLDREIHGERRKRLRRRREGDSSSQRGREQQRETTTGQKR
jgi:hypothetical protein